MSGILITLTSAGPAFQLNSAIVASAIDYSNLQYESIIVKQMINPFTSVGAAGQFSQDNRGVTSANWTRYYRNVINDLTDVLAKLKDNTSRSNTYGDIHYSQAGKAYLE